MLLVTKASLLVTRALLLVTIVVEFFVFLYYHIRFVFSFLFLFDICRFNFALHDEFGQAVHMWAPLAWKPGTAAALELKSKLALHQN